MLATVKGDVHDIGKNLVDIICTNNGYDVHNLGIKVGISDMVAKVKEVDADALGMSGLLVKSTLIMRENLEELNALGLTDIPVLLGGAALTRSYVERDLREVYEGRVFYGRDAFEGLRTMEQLMRMKRTGSWDPDFGRVPTGRVLPARSGRAGRARTPTRTCRARSPDVAVDNPVFRPPFVGSQVVKGLSLDEIAVYVNETALFRNQWQFRPESGESDEDFKARIRPTFRQHLAEAKASGVLVPQVVYGYFPVNGDGARAHRLGVGGARPRSWRRYRFPRQRQAPFLCIADFFRPWDGGAGELDYAAFHIVTMGAPVSEATARLFADNRYQEYLLLHGLGVEMAEALAEHWHHRIRTEWGFVDEDGPTVGGLFRQQYRGGRYSWGYPACPDLEDNATVAPPAGCRPPRHRGQRGDRLAVPARADHLRHHLPPPPGQVLRRPLTLLPGCLARVPGSVSRRSLHRLRQRGAEGGCHVVALVRDVLRGEEEHGLAQQLERVAAVLLAPPLVGAHVALAPAHLGDHGQRLEIEVDPGDVAAVLPVRPLRPRPGKARAVDEVAELPLQPALHTCQLHDAFERGDPARP